MLTPYLTTHLNRRLTFGKNYKNQQVFDSLWSSNYTSIMLPENTKKDLVEFSNILLLLRGSFDLDSHYASLIEKSGVLIEYLKKEFGLD
jgi:hypothetical protein